MNTVEVEMLEKKGNDSSRDGAAGVEDAEEDAGCVDNLVTHLEEWYGLNKRFISILVKLCLILLWLAYFIAAMVINFRHGFDPTNEPAIRLIAMNVVAVVCVSYWAVKKYFGQQIWQIYLGPLIKSLQVFFNKHWNVSRWLLAAVLLVAFILVMVDVGIRNPQNLISMLGMIILVIFTFIFSKHPSKVKWRPVVCGLILQFVFAYLILRTCVGLMIFQWIGDRTVEFSYHVDAGSKFMFGDNYEDHFVAFKVLPVIVFFSTIISMLSYLGWMQILIQKIAWVMQVCLGTTAGESLNAAANIFCGSAETPLMIKPMLPLLTQSEYHAVLTSGFATIAGSVLITFTIFGVSAKHLLSASIMSAPAALAVSKLFYPETEKSKTTVKDVQHLSHVEERNMIEAVSAGASASIALLANLAVNLIAFIGLMQFGNETLKWFGSQIGLELTFQSICSYLFWPLAWIMGVPAVDCRLVGTLLGVKIFINDFVGYVMLSDMIKNRALVSSWTESNGTTVYQTSGDCYSFYNSTYTTSGCIQQISERGELISTYILCGFSHFSSLGMSLGVHGALVPERKKDVAQIILRAMIAANIACYMTTCIAGLLSVPESETDEC